MYPTSRTSFAAVLGNVKDRVKHIQVGQADVAALRGQTVFYLGKLSYGEASAMIPKMLTGLTEGAYRIKGIVTALHKVMDRGDIRFLGNVDYGTDLSLAEISEAVGFNDYFYFIKKFKKVVGVTPGHFT